MQAAGLAVEQEGIKSLFCAQVSRFMRSSVCFVKLATRQLLTAEIFSLAVRGDSLMPLSVGKHKMKRSIPIKFARESSFTPRI